MSSLGTFRYGALVLAAGSSSRMGRPKQLLPWGAGTILQNVINSARESTLNEVVVVLGANSASIRETLSPDVVSVVNPDWQNGMGGSVACGVQFLQKQNIPFTTITILLGDQPFIDSDYINSMLSTYQENKKGIVATEYNGRAGVPALFASRYFEQLRNLNAKFGAKALLAKSISDIHLLRAGVKTADIDTEADYKKLNKLNR